MCTRNCNYDSDFAHLRGKTVIPSNDSIYQKLLGKDNLDCVNAFLVSIAHKVKLV